MVAKNPPANAGDVGSVPGSGRPGEGNGNPLPMFLPGESYGPGELRSMGSKSQTGLNGDTQQGT